MQPHQELPKLPPPPIIKEPERNPLSDAMYDIADALQYPKDHRGRRVDVRYLIPVLSYHLARAGCVVDPERAVIKKRRIPPTPGVVEDAIDWVPLDAPDRIDDELAGVTVDDIDRLSPAARAEFIRRLGGDPTGLPGADTPVAPTSDDLDARTPWHVETRIHFDDDERA